MNQGNMGRNLLDIKENGFPDLAHTLMWLCCLVVFSFNAFRVVCSQFTLTIPPVM